MASVEHRRNLIYGFAGKPPPVSPLPPGFQFARATPASVEAYFKGDEFQERRLRYLSFLEMGAAGFLVVKDEEWQAAGWIAPAGTALPGHMPPSLSRRYSWFLEAHTREEARGLGFHKYLAAKRLEFLAARTGGIARALADVNPANVASRRTIVGLGFQEVGVIDVWLPRVPRIPRKHLWWWRRSRPHPPVPPGLSSSAGGR